MTTSGFTRQLHQWQAKRQFRRRYLSALAELNALTHRDLVDIGMSSADFPEIATQMARSRR